jgi:uncharacterized membrane protein
VHDVLVVAASFAACAVEMVEALTIVLAVGVTRGWRAPAWGVTAALAGLGAVVALLGTALTSIPIDGLRLVVGTLMLIFGLQWLRKAILRASGLKALHDEEAIFAAEVNELRAAGSTSLAFDWYAFTVAFKGVFLEGLEVAFIVVTVGAAQGSMGLAIAGAAAALVVVLAAGLIVHEPLARVPENTLKFGVGIMLTSFGIFWSAEGAGVEWPGGEVAILAVVAFMLAVSLGLVAIVRRRQPASRLEEAVA